MERSPDEFLSMEATTFWTTDDRGRLLRERVRGGRSAPIVVAAATRSGFLHRLGAQVRGSWTTEIEEFARRRADRAACHRGRSPS